MNNLDRRTFLSGIAAVAASTPVRAGISQLGAGQNSPETTSGTTSLPNGRLQNKVGVVTGAARGIGCAVTVAFAPEGADIVGLDICAPVDSRSGCSTVDASGFGRNQATSTNGRPPLTSSTQAQHGTKFGASYWVSKWGIIGLMKCAALELGQYSITVNALIPGLIDTPLTRHKERYAQVLETAGQSPTGLSTAEDEADARKILMPGHHLACHGSSRKMSLLWSSSLPPTQYAWFRVRPTISPEATAPTTRRSFRHRRDLVPCANILRGKTFLEVHCE
jgi:hypothetical protein